MLQTMPNTIQIKYFTKALIEQFNCQTIVGGRKNCVNQDTINKMDEDTLFPVQQHYVADDNVRTQFVLNANGDTIIFDLTPSEWETLPHKDINKDV